MIVSNERVQVILNTRNYVLSRNCCGTGKFEKRKKYEMFLTIGLCVNASQLYFNVHYLCNTVLYILNETDSSNYIY